MEVHVWGRIVYEGYLALNMGSIMGEEFYRNENSYRATIWKYIR